MANRYYLEVAEDGRMLVRYDAVVNGDGIPAEAIPVSRKIFEQTLVKQSGAPYLTAEGEIEFRAIDPLTPEERAASNERAWRDNELESVKWLRERHRDEQDLEQATTLTTDQFAELLSYMQQLRDWPQAKKFPEIKYRPVAPEWIAGQVSGVVS